MGALVTWWGWAGFALVLGILEILLPSTIFLGFAMGAGVVAALLATGGIALFGGSLMWMLVVFAAASLLSWLLLRYVFRLRGGGQVKTFDTDIND